MKELLKIISILCYSIVGIISLLMAFKNFFSDKFLPFHEKASWKKWNEIEDRVQLVILSLMRVAGLGFLLMAILLIVFPIYNYFAPNKFLQYTIPVIAIIYCAGLAVFNYILHKNTAAETPWKKSIVAILLIIIGIIISML